MKRFQKLLKRIKLNKNNIKSLPESYGVYLFLEKDLPIYIGKANNLKNRVGSYFINNLTPKTKMMIKQASHFSIIKVNSELEALLLEAKLIRENKPHYNFSLRDDKRPLYIKITKEQYPKVKTARKIDEIEQNISFYGPFSSSGNVRSVLKMLRRIFPYSDHRIGKKGCILSQINLCSPCPNIIEAIEDENLKRKERKKYLENIKFIKGVLDGKFVNVRNKLIKNMKILSKNEQFEKAEFIKRQIEKLDYITQPITPINLFLKNPNLLEDIRIEESKALEKIINKYTNVSKNIKRIECFDVSHLSGTKPTASMITFYHGEPDKTKYRHFKIRQKKGSDDISSLREVALRREKYLSSWGIPDLILVDGGKSQVKQFVDVFEKHSILVSGYAKRSSSLIIPKVESGELVYYNNKISKGYAFNLIKRLINEAHRFARVYHHRLIRKEYINN